MKAADVMMKKIISVRPDTYVKEAVRVLLANRISAVLVLDEENGLMGILSEGDLLRRAEVGTERLSSWRAADLTPSSRQILAEEFVKSHSLKVTDVMTRSVITAEPGTPLAEIARLLEKNHIKRVPIVENDKVVGVVSRANILQALANFYDDDSAQDISQDADVRDRIVTELNAQPWFRAGSITVVVRNGMVDLCGMVESTAERNAVRVTAEIAPGVQGVNDRLILRAEES